jgi:hypothetical protein
MYASSGSNSSAIQILEDLVLLSNIAMVSRTFLARTDINGLMESAMNHTSLHLSNNLIVQCGSAQAQTARHTGAWVGHGGRISESTSLSSR